MSETTHPTAVISLAEIKRAEDIPLERLIRKRKYATHVSCSAILKEGVVTIKFRLSDGLRMTEAKAREIRCKKKKDFRCPHCATGHRCPASEPMADDEERTFQCHRCRRPVILRCSHTPVYETERIDFERKPGLIFGKTKTLTIQNSNETIQ